MTAGSFPQEILPRSSSGASMSTATPLGKEPRAGLIRNTKRIRLSIGVMSVQAFLIALVVAIAVLAAPGGTVMVDRIEGNLRYEASIAKKAFDPGEAVEVALAVRNTGSSPAPVTFSSGQRYDLVIRRPRGDEVWRWSHDKAFIQVVQTVTLKPGEALPFRVAWDQRDLQGRRVDPGTYEAVAVFMGRVEGADRPSLQLQPLQFTIR